MNAVLNTIETIYFSILASFAIYLGLYATFVPFVDGSEPSVVGVTYLFFGLATTLVVTAYCLTCAMRTDVALIDVWKASKGLYAFTAVLAVVAALCI